MFLNELQRRRHSQAGLIPQKIWKRYFKQQLTRSEIQLMTTMPQRIHFHSMKWRKKTVYLCLLSAYPKIEPSVFFNIVEWNHESILFALKAICLMNRLDLLSYFATHHPDEFQNQMECDHFSLVREAVSEYSLKIICSLFTLFKGDVEPILQAHGYQVFVLCGWRSEFKIRLFDFLLALKPIEFSKIPIKNRFWIFNRALINNNEPLVHRILALWPQGAELLLRKSNYEAYMNVVTSKNLTLLRYLFSLNYCSKDEVVRHNNHAIIHHAVKKGNLRIVNELCEHLSREEMERLIRENEYEIVFLAASYGRVRIFNQFFKHISKQENPKIEARLFKTFISAASKGKVPMLVRLMSCFPSHCEAMNAAEDYAAFRKAAQHGQLPVLEFLSNKFPQKTHEMIRSDNFYAFRNVPFLGARSVVKFLVRSYPQITPWMIAANEFEVLINACHSQDVTLVKWLASQIPGRSNRWVFAHEGMPLLHALARANFPLIKFLMTLLGDDVSDFLMGITPNKLVSNITDVRVLKYIISVCPELKDRLVFSSEYNLFEHAIRSLYMGIVEYIVHEYADQLWDIIETKKYSIVFSLIKYNKDASVVRLFSKVIPHFNRIICFTDMLADVALYSENPTFFNYLINGLSLQQIHELLLDQDFMIFRAAIKNGNLDIIRRIDQLTPMTPQELIEGDATLIHAAIANKNLELLEFLLSRCHAQETKTIFHKSKKRNARFLLRIRRMEIEEASIIFNAESLFLDPAQLTIKEKLNLVFSSIVMGYVFIAKTMAYQLFGNKYFYCKMLLELAQSKPNASVLLPCLVDFLRTRIGLSEEQLQCYLTQQSFVVSRDRGLKRLAR